MSYVFKINNTVIFFFVIVFLQARTEWNQLQNFSEEMQDKRTILKSVLDPNPERPVVNGNGLGIRIPNLLLQEFQKDIQMVRFFS